MGSPPRPSAEHYARLVKGGGLAALGEPATVLRVENANATVRLTLPRQALSLLVLSW